MQCSPLATVPLALLAMTSGLHAQWPTSPSTNLPIGDGVGEQVLPKIAIKSDGGAYIGWFDNRSGAYAVYLQRLDAAGAEQWPHGGVLVSANPQSTSLVDWDLICDSQDHCVLVFTDTRVGGDLDVYAYRIAPNALFVWGQNGITLSNNGDYEPSPRVCETTSGLFAFAWTNTVTATIQHQLVYAHGTPIYPANGYSIAADPGATPGFCRIAAGDNNSYVIGWVRTTAFTGNKHVHAQKFGPGGNPMWNGGTRIAVFDGGSVPIAHEPRLVPDGSGGAVFAWHFAAGNVFSCRVQHVLANGSEAFAHDGVDVSTSGLSKFDPAIVWQPATQELFAVWNERNVAQTTWGLAAQKLDALGARQWGASGVTLMPSDTVVKFAPVAARFGPSGITAAVLEESLGILQKKIWLFGLDGAGAASWPAVAVCTVGSDKLRLNIGTTPSGTSVLAWTDKRSDAGDVIAQAVDAAGNLGVTLATATAYGCGVNPAGSLFATGRPAIGATTVLSLTNPLGTQAGGATLGVLFLGLGPAPGFPCGVSIPGWGMSGTGQPGEVLLDLTSPIASFTGGIWTGVGQPVEFAYAAPMLPGLMGQSLYAQGLLVDLSPAAAIVFALSNAVRLTLGS
ncbi:MAG TPA: hypothetical protein VF384_05285 [Planctomycetota bacterium]